MSWNNPTHSTNQALPTASEGPSAPLPPYAYEPDAPPPTSTHLPADGTKTTTATKALIVGGSVLSVVALAALSVIGLSQIDARSEYYERLSKIASTCAERPHAAQVGRLMEQSWFRNDYSPDLKTTEQAVEDFDSYCQTRTDLAVQLWVTQADIDEATLAEHRILTAKKDITASIDDAFAYADFSYAVVQTAFAKGQALLYARGSTDPDTAYAEVDKIEKALKDTISITDEPQIDAHDLRNHTVLLRKSIADYKDFLAQSPSAASFQEAIHALEPVHPGEFTPQRGMIPLFMPSDIPAITYSDDELGFHIPDAFASFTHVSTDKGSDGSPRFGYSKGRNIAYFQEIDFPAEVFPNGYRFSPDNFLTYTGHYDEVWSPKSESGAEHVLVVRSSDGRFWQATVSGNTDAATYRGIGYTWLKAFH